MKFITRVKRFIFGKPRKRIWIPSIAELSYRLASGINDFKFKEVSDINKINWLLCRGSFLVNAKYPASVKLKKGEIGADILLKTRYIYKKK